MIKIRVLVIVSACLSPLLFVALRANHISAAPAASRGQSPKPNQFRLLPQAKGPGFTLKNIDPEKQQVTVLDSSGKEATVLMLQKAGPWSLMAVIEEGGRPIAVFENIEDKKGDILYLSGDGVVVSLPKSLERTSVPPNTLYRGKTLDEVTKTRRDFLSEEILAEKGDPTFEKVAAVFPPLRIPTFVGTRYSIDKPTFDYGAFSDEIYVDVGKVFPEIAAARKKLDVWEGIVGGWLPVPRWVFPAGEKRYWDVVIFAEEDPSKFWTQPIWFRILLVEDGKVKEAHHFYHHLPIPPRGEPQAREFYKALLKVHTEWQKTLVPSFRVEVAEKNISDFCLHALAMEMITRVGDHPKYGYPPLGGVNVFGGYGYSNVDTFQDTFNTSVITFLEWGLFDIARRYVEDYFTQSVRDDGSIDTRGAEQGEYGFMLVAMAQYYNYTNDHALILKHLAKLRAIVGFTTGLWVESRKLPPADPAYGIIRGWSEHDSCLKENPYGLVQPFFSNNAAASRGFQDLGNVLIEIGRKTSNAGLEEEGKKMIRDAADIKKDLYAGIEKSIRRDQNPPYLPSVAGDKSLAFQPLVYTEMLHSAVLTPELARTIYRYQFETGGRPLGRGGFRFYAYGYGMIQQDWVREFLLSYYSNMAHVYSRGTWTAVENGLPNGTKRSPYCSPAELIIPALTKWMLVFDDPNEPVLWLAKATPSAWLENGQKISVKGAPSRYGKVEYELRSEIARGRVLGAVSLPSDCANATAKVRIRVPDDKKMKRVAVNGKAWKEFDPALDLITLPKGLTGQVVLEVSY